MLDKELCKLAGIDEYLQTIMKELDWAEEQLYDPAITPIKYIEVKARYETLKEMRDAYCRYRSKSKNKKNQKLQH